MMMGGSDLHLLLGILLVATTVTGFSSPIVHYQRIGFRNGCTSRFASTVRQEGGSASSSSKNSNAGEDDDDKKRNSEMPPKKIDDDDSMRDIPWSQVQNWALMDNLPKYTVSISLKDPISGKDSTKSYALWRALTREVSELAGYSVDILQRRLLSSKEEEMPAVLPYLDEFAFASGGGVTGKVYGVPGLADGTRIETSDVSHVEITLPRGYVRTADGSTAYELGRAQSEIATTTTSIDDFRLKERMEQAAVGSGYMLSNVAKGGSKLANSVADEIEDPDSMLVRLGATTGLLLAGATAMNMLSHHLTVNVFWV